MLYLAKNDNNAVVLKKEAFSLDLLFKEVVDETLLIHPDYSVSYICETSFMLVADYAAIKQILRILIDNSIKFSSPPGNIIIKAIVSFDGFTIVVSDQGCGIPSEALPHILTDSTEQINQGQRQPVEQVSDSP